MMEKSGCLQLTQEEYALLRNAVDGNCIETVKFASVMSDMLSNLTGPDMLDDLRRILDSGEYRIVDAN